ncbi:MAG: ADP-ribose pyrophosphatase YjhB (NUDIX family) [Verrucomicrobiales bacterium]|jgi:ADP-ribose pyrophosphatase YjhB (NUDIX family)
MSKPKDTITEQHLLRWSEMLSALARTGLAFTESLYEQERFEEILLVAAEIHAGSSLDIDPETLVQEWTKTIGHGVPGYVTPKNTVGAMVGNDDGELLLMQRADSGIWLYPTGWADVGYSPAEVAVKEVWEETGIQTEVVRLLGVYDGMRLGFTKIPLYSTVFHLRAIGGELKAHPLECRDVGFFTEDSLPEPLVGADRWIGRAFAAVRGEQLEVEFDGVRTPPWEEHHA